MANTILRSNYQSKTFGALGLFCLVLMVQRCSAREFTVKWGLHNGTYSENYNQWAERNRFQIGDSLVFVYTPNDDSVLHVTEAAYKNCSVEAPLAEYKDGHTVFSLSRSGAFYFISGKQDNCQKNEKLVVVVLADRGNSSSTSPSPAPSSSVGLTPSMAPSGASPPAQTVENSPSQAPAEGTSSKKNAASSLFITSATGSIGAFVASTLLLAL